MAIRVIWDTADRTAIRAEFEYDWNWDDFYAALLKVVRLASEDESRVDLIVDLSDSRSLNSSAAYYCQRWIDLWPANIGHVAVITKQPVIAAVVSLVTRLSHRCRGNASVVGSLEEARAVLLERREES